jgi:hypothetical protein
LDSSSQGQVLGREQVFEDLYHRPRMIVSELVGHGQGYSVLEQYLPASNKGLREPLTRFI